MLVFLHQIIWSESHLYFWKFAVYKLADSYPPFWQEMQFVGYKTMNSERDVKDSFKIQAVLFFKNDTELYNTLEQMTNIQ